MRVACVQLNPADNFDLNVKQAFALIKEAQQKGADTIVLPEMFSYMGTEEGRIATAENFGQGTFLALTKLSKDLELNIVAGSLAEKSSNSKKVYNTSVAINPKGDVVSTYRKLHLFNLKDENGQPLYCESNVFEKGDKAIASFDLTSQDQKWHCLTAICYDLRFPEVFRTADVKKGFYDVIFLPSAFTLQTGRDHWEVLLRARAIENQCFVVACNQTGSYANNTKHNYGHSMVIDPWGRVVASLDDKPGVLVVDISKEAIKESRTKLPALTDRLL